jgi:hypothetical protein
VELVAANVLTVECTGGQQYDALYSDATVAEEDLPALLALLRPCGRAVVRMEEVRTTPAWEAGARSSGATGRTGQGSTGGEGS